MLKRPWSSLGRKPFGTIVKRYAVAASSTTDTAIVVARNRNAPRSVQSYSRSHASNMRSVAL